MFYSFHLRGPFVPYVRMTQRGKWVKARAQEYLASKDALGWQFKEQMQQNEWEMIPRGMPLSVTIGIVRTEGLHTRDLDNEVKAILDAAQGIVFEDDRWIDVLRAHRERGGDDVTTVVVGELSAPIARNLRTTNHRRS
jgi:crossover junction endodeoxyribonuclease RusA